MPPKSVPSGGTLSLQQIKDICHKHASQPYKLTETNGIEPIVCKKCKTIDFASRTVASQSQKLHNSGNCEQVSHSISKDQSKHWYTAERARLEFAEKTAIIFLAYYFDNLKVPCPHCKLVFQCVPDVLDDTLNYHIHHTGKDPQACRFWPIDSMWSYRLKQPREGEFHHWCNFCSTHLSTDIAHTQELLTEHITGQCTRRNPLLLFSDDYIQHLEKIESLPKQTQDVHDTYHFFIAQARRHIKATIMDYTLEPFLVLSLENNKQLEEQREAAGLDIMPLAAFTDKQLNSAKKMNAVFKDWSQLASPTKEGLEQAKRFIPRALSGSGRSRNGSTPAGGSTSNNPSSETEKKRIRSPESVSPSTEFEWTKPRKFAKAAEATPKVIDFCDPNHYDSLESDSDEDSVASATEASTGITTDVDKASKPGKKSPLLTRAARNDKTSRRKKNEANKQPSSKVAQNNPKAKTTGNKGGSTSETNEPQPPKPPPIIMVGTPTEKGMLALERFNKKLSADLSIKVTGTRTRILCKSSEDHRKTMAFLEQYSVDFYTYPPKEAAPSRYVVKGVPLHVSEETLAELLIARGLPEPAKVVRMKSRRTQQQPEQRPLLCCQVTYFGRSTTLKDLVDKAPSLGLTEVKWERFRGSGKPPVCARCQGIGHVETACNVSHNCGICGEDHDTQYCSDKLQIAPDSVKNYCHNCHGNHRASWKGCPKITEYVKKRQAAQPPRAEAPPKTYRDAPPPKTNAWTNRNRNRDAHLDVANGSSWPPPKRTRTEDNNASEDLLSQVEKTAELLMEMTSADHQMDPAKYSKALNDYLASLLSGNTRKVLSAWKELAKAIRN